MCSNNLIKNLIPGVLFMSVIPVFSQSIGKWNGSSVQTSTSGAVGVGTSRPEAWEEIEYCQNSEVGLIVTKLDVCSGSVGMSSSPNVKLDGVVSYSGSPTGTPDNEIYNNFVPVDFRFLPVLSSPLRWKGQTLVSQAVSNFKPLIWAREKSSVFPGTIYTRFVVSPEGRVGINMPSPRAFLDVWGNPQANVPIAIFGTRSGNFTRHVHIVSNLGRGAYNDISKNGDLGLFYTDGSGSANDGSNEQGSLVIAPWSAKAGVGGLRMDPKGNVELRGDLRTSRVVVNAQWWPDHVFNKNYSLISIDSVASFIEQNHHLPGMPSQDTVCAQGQDIGEIQKLQQQKIEELTLYIIQQQKMMDEQAIMMKEQAARLESIEKRNR